VTELATRRLLLRRWRPGDRPAMHALNSDPAVMATIGSPMTRTQSDAMVDRIEDMFDVHGFGLWCVDRDGTCIGFTGLSVPWFRDGIEIGWRIRSEYWRHGFATEAATAVLAHAFDDLGLDEVISFTAAVNARSIRVMERIGLRRDPKGDFDHPSLIDGDPLQPHVLYRLTADEYRAES
jgi:RimJ/RimL family protein N-acetyltransferase